ncbi:glycosyl hydrolase [uncultured Pontibacter sp.]|uniref:glycosyl hydrolase n=1 Tax=uncultured Pontibacter sp. TaxID=453356 RepID=UPI00260BBFDE|nr:glycosyl hydrolase [uncultured Pontibacter sp.]
MIYTLAAEPTISYLAATDTRNRIRQRLLFFILLALFILAGISLFKAMQVSPHTAEQGFNGPLIITKGGTYSGNWESKDSDVPAIDIRTKEPVTIENSIIRGAGPLIRSLGYSANITVRNTYGYGITPTPYSDYKKPRRFLAIDAFRNIIVENCYMENTAGIYLGQRYEGDGTPQNTVKIRYNKVKNIDGRIYNGMAIVQFVQFNYRGEAPHIEVAWNEIINEPDNSAVEDNINIYNSRGTKASPIQIHNNFIKGAYPVPATSKTYTGGGILTDSPGTDSTMATAYVKVYDNQLVGLGNYCLGIAGGNNIEMYKNRAIVSARLPDGSFFSCWSGGIWAKDYYKLHSTFNNKMHSNILGVVGQTGTWRNEIMDSTFLAASTFANTILESDITLSMEEKEYQLWLKKLEAHDISLGPAPAKRHLNVSVE